MAELNKDVMGKQEEKAERKVFIVNCNKCGAALKVKDGALAYICGACSHVFQIRKIEKIITDDGLEVKLEEPTAPAEESLDIPVQSDISNVEEAKEDTEVEAAIEEQEDTKEETVEMVAEKTQPAVEETAAEEKEEMQAVEEPTVKEKTSEMLTWEPEVDEGEEEGWEDDDRQRELPIWQEEEAEEGWDEE